MKVFGDLQSGNCYKVKLVCHLLQIPHEWIQLDILAGDTRQTAFLAKNPLGKIPLLQLDDGRCLAESNAIINYLATGSALLPTDPFKFAKLLQWQFFEQYSHEPYIAVARFIAKYLGLPEARRTEYEAKQAGGHRALTVMNQQLQQTPYLIGQTFSTADISLYAYTHVAHEGGFDLSAYPAVQAWLNRIQTQPYYVDMKAT
ncbi:MAG: glutathione S-transferase family protein [Pseudomonadota bacterium]|nr:glutathione S-transferase family protein [Pseudomonadota bacterium]